MAESVERRREVFDALFEVHSEEYALAWIDQHKIESPREREMRGEIVLQDYELLTSLLRPGE